MSTKVFGTASGVRALLGPEVTRLEIIVVRAYGGRLAGCARAGCHFFYAGGRREARRLQKQRAQRARSAAYTVSKVTAT